MSAETALDVFPGTPQDAQQERSGGRDGAGERVCPGAEVVLGRSGRGLSRIGVGLAGFGREVVVSGRGAVEPGTEWRTPAREVRGWDSGAAPPCYHTLCGFCERLWQVIQQGGTDRVGEKPAPARSRRVQRRRGTAVVPEL